jgi:hypothetical protein
MVFGLELKFEIIILMRSHHLLSMIAALLILISPSVSADYHNKSWKPQAIKYDWLQLTSGEWLKGEFMSMCNEILEFDSKKLDLLFIMISTLKSEITRDLDLDISAVWDRISHPTEDDTGNLPEPDDYRLLLGLSYSF